MYAEWDNIETINAIKEALEIYHEVILVEADHNAYEKFRSIKPDIVFNVSEGINGAGREAQIPAILDLLDIPYTGSDPLTLSICLDKARTKEILTYHSIPNARFNLIESIDQLDRINSSIQFPIIAKPVREGSSKGIFNSSFIENDNELNDYLKENLNNYKQPFILEEFLPGREFTVAVIGNGRDTEILPIIEMNFSSLPENLLPIYSYEAKWIYDTPENPLDIYVCPAQIDQKLEKEIKEIVLKTYTILRCRDWCRIDVRLDIDDKPQIIEVNPLPGVLPDPNDNSCFPKAARESGMDYNTMINTVLFHAAKRNNLI